MQFLRSNTAVIVTVGPFYDKTDGVTIETALTITNERITLTADTDDGSAPTNILDNVTGATSGTSNDLNYITGNDAGMMQLELSAANVNRLGRMKVSITDAANHVPVFHDFLVVPQPIYDWFIAGTTLGANPQFGIIDSGTAQSATGTTLVLRSAAGFADDELNGATILITGGSAGVGQRRIISDYVGSTDTATVSGWTTIPTGTITYNIFASAAGEGVAQTGDAYSIVNSGTFGNAALKTLVDAVDNFVDTEITDIQSRLPAALVSGRIDASVGAMAANTMTAAAAAADLTTELQSGLATAAALTTVSGLVDDLESRLGTPSNLGGGASIAANLADIEAQTDDIGTAGAGLTAVPWNASWDTEVQSEVQDAIEANHLDHLFAVDYDPASKPGVATALLNELIESDAGVSQFTANALEEAPTGAGGGLDAAQTRAALGLASANLDTQLGDLPTNAELATSQAAADDATLAAISALNNVSTAQVLTQVQSALTTAVADSIPADGSRPSIAQAVYLLTQFMLERGIVGTTETVYKPDGTTALLTLTLNSATTPTAVTRAT